MTPSKNPLIALIDTFRSPVECFAAVYKHPKWAILPYLFILFGSFIFWGSYFNHVDISWLQQAIQVQLSSIGENVQPTWLTKEVLLAGEVFSDLTGRTAVIFILALWLTLATKGSTHQHSYGKWLAASCFIMLPVFIGDIASYINVIFNNTSVLPNAADLNSINGLLKLPLNNPWAPLATTIPLLAPWYMALTYTVVSAWTDFDRAKAIIVAILPWILILVIWPLMIIFA